MADIDKTARPKAAAKVRAAKAHEKAVVLRSKAKEKGGAHASGFMTFIREQGVLGLAVGLVIGGAVAILARSLIDNVVMPPLGFVLGSSEGLKGLTVTIGKAGGKEATINYGIFLNDLVNFLVLALVIYLVVHLLGFDKIEKKKAQ